MSGVFELNDRESWIAASWVYDHVLRLVRAQLTASEDTKILQLLEDGTDPNLRFVSLRHLDEEDRARFSRALTAALKRARRDGVQTFGTPEFFEGFMERLRALEEIAKKKGD